MAIFPTPSIPSTLKSHPGRKGKYTPQAWEHHRKTISSMRRGGRTTEAIRQHMLHNHGFNASVKMYKTRMKHWGLGKNLCKKHLFSMHKIQLLNYGEHRKSTVFYRHDKKIDLDKEFRDRNMCPYTSGGDAVEDARKMLERPSLPESIKAICVAELPMTYSMAAPDILQYQEVIMKLNREICLEGRRTDRSVSDFWKHIRGRVGKGPFNRLKDCYLAQARDYSLQLLMYDAAIDELQYELKGPLRLGPLNTLRLVFGNSRWKDIGLTATIWRTIASQTAIAVKMPEGHRLPHLFEQLRRLLVDHGHQTFLELLNHCAPAAAEEVQKHYGADHPYTLEVTLYVVRYCDVGRDKLLELLPTAEALQKAATPGSREDIALSEYIADVATAAGLSGPLCQAHLDRLLRAAAARPSKSSKEQRNIRLTLATVRHRMWALREEEGERPGPTTGGRALGCSDNPRRQLAHAINYLVGALASTWKCETKRKVARVISWMDKLQGWLAEGENHEGAMLVGRRRVEIQNAPMGEDEKLVPLAGISRRLMAIRI